MRIHRQASSNGMMDILLGLPQKFLIRGQFLNALRLKAALICYWANTGDNILIKKLIAKSSISMKSELELVLRNEPVEQSIKESITFPELDHRSELVWSLLLFTAVFNLSNV